MARKIHTGVRLPKPLFDAISRQAARDECSVSEMIRFLLMRAIYPIVPSPIERAEEEKKEQRHAKSHSQRPA